MKAEDVEVGFYYFVLENLCFDNQILLKSGSKVEVVAKYDCETNGCLVRDAEKEKNSNKRWVVKYNCLEKIVEAVETPTDKYEQHRQLCEKIHETYVAKNKDYGDSFTRTRKEAKYPELVIITRLSDKFYRLKTLLEGAEQQVKSESIDDTLLDLANYCLMEIIERQNGGDK